MGRTHPSITQVFYQEQASFPPSDALYGAAISWLTTTCSLLRACTWQLPLTPAHRRA